jgi:primosomal protein N' (replication factor Y) (superfamily II helicase)
MKTPFVDVLVPVALDRAYSYRVPEDLAVAPGDLVRVPLGPRSVTGAVWETDVQVEKRLHNRVKEIEAKLDLPPLHPELRRFIEWVADYTLGTRGMVLRMSLRMGEHLGPARARVAVRSLGHTPKRMTAARARVLAVLEDELAHGKSELAQAAGVSPSVVDGLIDEGVVETLALPPERVASRPDPDFAHADLEPAQQEAAGALRKNVRHGGFGVTLLDGVTGSGKTQVYFEAVAEAVRQKRQALVLVPEIALTGQFLERFAKRFGVQPAEWHSQLSERLRARTRRAVAEGEASVVVGARSALFLPYAQLGLIVVDEEHDPAYKQEDGVRYHARDMAVVRAREARVPIVLVSATPSVETEVNARAGRYARLHLPERFGGSEMPSVCVLDLRTEGPPRGKYIAPRLVTEIRSRMERGEQALLFLNRRGYAPLTLCRQCGFRLGCPNCDAWLVQHRFRNRLVCHHCGYAMPLPAQCPHCLASGSFVPVGPGVERLEAEARELFPESRILVLSSDLVESVERLRQELAEVAAGRFDIIVGTQLIAKGHHFPNLNLVGIIDADLGLANGDPRAAERTFQLLHQVVGRAGREGARGIGFIQTHQPEHPVVRALAQGDREGFYASEIELRKATSYPPFGRLVSVIVSASERSAAEAYARAIAKAAPHVAEVRLLGPAEAPLAVVRGRHRFRLLLKSPRRFDLSAYLRECLADAPAPKGDVKLEVDVDPQSFL